MSIRPDGTDPQTITVVATQPTEVVADLRANRSGDYLLYGITRASNPYEPFPHEYYLLHEGVTSLRQAFTTPRWSPEGTRFVAEAMDAAGEPGPIYLYDVLQSAGRQLRASGSADWFPDGKRLIYAHAGNVFTYDLATDTVIQLTSLPHDAANRWEITAAHMLPDGSGVLFFGGVAVANGAQITGPHGEGQQWWWMAAAGGPPRAWADSDPRARGGYNYAASPRGDRVAYTENFFGGAGCPNQEQLTVVEVARAKPGRAPGIGFDATTSTMALVGSLSWSPRGESLAFGVDWQACPYREATQPKPEQEVIYLWQPSPANTDQPAPRRLVLGSEPIWVDMQ